MSSAPTSRFSRILRSASFRMTLAYVGLFVVSAGVLFATVYFTATAAMQSDMQAVLRSEAYQLGEIHRRSGLLGVAQEITKRINFRTRGPIYYLLQGPSQQVMVGNLPGMPPVNGAIDFAREDNAAPTSERARLMGFGLTLPDGSFILVAQDTSRLLDMQRAIESAFAWAGGLTLLLAIAGGVRRSCAMARSVGEAYLPAAEDSQHRLVLEIQDGVTFNGDRQLLAQMLSNLIENALHHTPDGTIVTVTVRKPAGKLEIEVADTGPGIPQAERDKVFERFYRLDRSRGTAGSGLGLALVKAIAGLHGLSIRLEERTPGLAVVIGRSS